MEKKIVSKIIPESPLLAATGTWIPVRCVHSSMNDAAPKPCELSMCVLIPWQVRKIESIKLNARERDSSPRALLSI